MEALTRETPKSSWKPTSSVPDTSATPDAVISRRTRFARELTTIVAAPALIWLIGWAPDSFYISVISLVCALARL